MTICRGVLSNRVPLEELPSPLTDIGVLASGGLIFRPTHGFVCLEAPDIPGLAFSVTTDAGVEIGTASLLFAPDIASVARTGHIGAELLPDFRGQGRTGQIVRSLLPVLRENGVADVLLTCDEGQEASVKICLGVGATPIDDLPPMTPDGATKRRFLLSEP